MSFWEVALFFAMFGFLLIMGVVGGIVAILHALRPTGVFEAGFSLENRKLRGTLSSRSSSEGDRTKMATPRNTVPATKNPPWTQGDGRHL